MVSTKIVWVMIIVAILLLAVSLVVSISASNIKVPDTPTDMGGNNQGNIGIGIAPQVNSNASQ
jgi:flagellar basal body-associated protein FliL